MDVTNNKDEFDHKLFEPTHDDWDADEDTKRTWIAQRKLIWSINMYKVLQQHL